MFEKSFFFLRTKGLTFDSLVTGIECWWSTCPKRSRFVQKNLQEEIFNTPILDIKVPVLSRTGVILKSTRSMVIQEPKLSCRAFVKMGVQTLLITHKKEKIGKNLLICFLVLVVFAFLSHSCKTLCPMIRM